MIEHKKLGSIPNFDNNVKLSAHAVSPDIYEIVHEDELIKVYTATFPAGSGDNVHEHGMNTAYVITGGKVEITGADGSVNRALGESDRSDRENDLRRWRTHHGSLAP